MRCPRGPGRRVEVVRAAHARLGRLQSTQVGTRELVRLIGNQQQTEGPARRLDRRGALLHRAD
eukprot:10042051-Alexandrium_andersonii.AAC.1